MLTPRYYQQDAFLNFMDYVSANHGKHPLIVLPTGSGKSLVQAMIVKSVIEDSDKTRVLLLTHQKELIKQNYEEIAGLFTDQLIDIGIYSAGLGLRDTKSRILLAGIQSVYKKAWTDIGFYDLIMIDEAHLVPHGAEGMYRTFLKDMQNINKNIVIAGLSATPYRLKSGLLCEGDGALFDAICHETSIAELMDATNWRNKDRTQYLCKLISPSTAMKSKVDLSQVHIRGGEFVAGELEDAFNKDDLIDASVKEIIEYSASRNKVLVFTAGKEHCENVFRHFEHYGQTCGFVHSDMDAKANDSVLSKFKSGEIKYLVNVNILTTGFNVKDVDCVAVLRSTMSPGLWVQICGRGSRLHPSKENCLILDFGGNIERHGPIDKIEVRKKKSGGSEVATAPQKACPQCTFLMPLSVMVCENCGFEFPSKDKHDDKASQKNILSEWAAPSDYDVVLVRYSRHEKNGSPDSLKVMYYYDAYNYYAEWVCLDHPGYAGRKAQNWLRTRIEHVPEGERPDINGVDDALAYTHVFKEPVAITVDLNEKFPRIVGYKFQEENAILIDTTKSTE
jgi:DNA repair protein RadD